MAHRSMSGDLVIARAEACADLLQKAGYGAMARQLGELVKKACGCGACPGVDALRMLRNYMGA